MNRQSIQLDGLETKVRQLMEPNSEALVIVQADTVVDHGQVVAVMDRLREIPGAKLAIATKQP
ncbi:MAG: biopolymer transporter ExbD [Coleofasciculus sp. A1-SPW-01]|uniref:ExbD/TolR family protein n=1 Tax=Coleofasciculus sp. A1-SPW-01 TaxID=3070819 RepID=UPI003302479F